MPRIGPSEILVILCFTIPSVIVPLITLTLVYLNHRRLQRIEQLLDADRPTDSDLPT